MDALFQLLYAALWRLLTSLEPALVPICFVAAWGIIILGAWHVVSTVRHGIAQAQRMHRIPCADCLYFTNSHLLKCPLHPVEALSEAAIDCSDYRCDSPLAGLEDRTS